MDFFLLALLGCLLGAVIGLASKRHQWLPVAFVLLAMASAVLHAVMSWCHLLALCR